MRPCPYPTASSSQQLMRGLDIWCIHGVAPCSTAPGCTHSAQGQPLNSHSAYATGTTFVAHTRRPLLMQLRVRHSLPQSTSWRRPNVALTAAMTLLARQNPLLDSMHGPFGDAPIAKCGCLVTPR